MELAFLHCGAVVPFRNGKRPFHVKEIALEFICLHEYSYVKVKTINLIPDRCQSVIKAMHSNRHKIKLDI